MSLSQFSCPHCLSPFQVDASLPSQQVACPHCRQPVALINEPPVSEPPVSEPPLAAPPAVDSPPVQSVAAGPPPRVLLGDSPAAQLPPGSAVSAEEVPANRPEERGSILDDFRSRQHAFAERAARKFVKNMIVWVCCAIVLVSVLAFFLMQRGS